VKILLLRSACGLALGAWLTPASAAPAPGATDWPQFRGPDGRGIAVGATPPSTWSATSNLKWQTDLPGPGSSSPIVVSARVLVTCWSGYGDGSGGGPENLKRHLLCLDRANGHIVWQKTVAAEHNVDSYEGFLQEHGFASSTPASDGRQVFVYFGKAGALGFDLDGRQLWQVVLGTDSNRRNWGSASSPILYQDKVIINASEEAHAVFALDQATGRQLWKAEGATLENVFGTPMLAKSDLQTDALLAVPEEVWALNADTGKLRWYVESGLSGNIAPSMVVGDGVAYAFGGFPRLAAVAVRLGGKGDMTKTNLLWSGYNSSYVPTPVLHDGKLYFASDAGFATCLDARIGVLVFKERLPGASARGGGKPFYAAAVLANGNVYAVSRRNGTFVFAARPALNWSRKTSSPAMIPISMPRLRCRAGNSFCAPTGLFTASSRCRRRTQGKHGKHKTHHENKSHPPRARLGRFNVPADGARR